LLASCRLHRPRAPVRKQVRHGVGAPRSPSLGEIMRFARGQLAPYKRVRRLEFAELPKTISGKIRRVELRDDEHARTQRSPQEFWEDDFPELKRE